LTPFHLNRSTITQDGSYRLLKKKEASFDRKKLAPKVSKKKESSYRVVKETTAFDKQERRVQAKKQEQA
jgi:hypothetical protein